MRRIVVVLSLLLLASFCALGAGTRRAEAQSEPEIIAWIDPLNFQSDSPYLGFSFDAVLGGLVIASTSSEDYFIAKGLQVPLGYELKGVRLCYVPSSSSSITGVELYQFDPDPEKCAYYEVEMMNDAELNGCCHDILAVEPIDPEEGAVQLRLGLSFEADDSPPPDPDTSLQQTMDEDQIELLAVGLILKGDPLRELKNDLKYHNHCYLTGRGVGHNKKRVWTGTAKFDDEMPRCCVPWKNNGKKNGSKKGKK